MYWRQQFLLQGHCLPLSLLLYSPAFYLVLNFRRKYFTDTETEKIGI